MSRKMLPVKYFSSIGQTYSKRCNKKSVIFYFGRHYSEKGNKFAEEVRKVRNIGILAHIDAGKTTTTERMLYYSGRIKHMGEVHLGNTVTDYMEQERNRGITITSAAVSFSWNGHRFNLIDTPGHIDFTMEVEQALNVMDGVIIVLDGSAGVEAQTLTVWRQADYYKIPRMVFTNKMDRQDASLKLCLHSLKDKFGICPLPLHLPIKRNSKLIGLVDLISLEKCFWMGENGETIETSDLTKNDGQLWEESLMMRERLIDNLTDIDNDLSNKVITLDSIQEISSSDLTDAIKRSTQTQTAVPVLCGSAYKNVGVQTLMDGVINFLPSPSDCPQLEVYSHFGEELAARVFKVTHDKHKGPLSFLRLYAGHLKKGQKVYNMKLRKYEHLSQILEVEADNLEEISQVSKGNIAAVSGLKHTVSGDLLTSSSSAATAAKKSLGKEKHISEEEAEEKFNIGATIPEPVFFCSIEPASQAYQKPLDDALEELKKEDPSMQVSFDEEIGQTIVAGMGELHLEVIRDRIKSEYKIDADIGPMQIAYKEKPLNALKETYSVSHNIGNNIHSIKVTLSILPEKKKELLVLDRSKENCENVAAITPRQIKAIKQGLDSGLAHGPILGCPIIDVSVMLHYFEVGRNTSDTIIISGVAQCIKKLMNSCGTVLLEPVMSLEVITDEKYLPIVLTDLNRRRSKITNVAVRGNNKIVNTLTPLAELLGYSKDLRTFTSGTATFAMEFESFKSMGPLEQAAAIKKVTGF